MTKKTKKPTQRSKGGTRGTLFRDAGQRHLHSAGILLKNKCEHDSLYHGGYSIECMLKYAITRSLRLIYLPADLEIHDLDKLLAASGFESALKQQPNLYAAYSTLAEFWGPNVRYQAPTLAKGEAERLYNHIVQLYQWLAEQAV